VRNCTRDEGGPFEVGNQVLISSHRKLLSSKAMVVSVAEKSGQEPGRQGLRKASASKPLQKHLDPDLVRQICEKLNLDWSELPGPKGRA
jgi:hypothetical protein